MTDDDIEVTYSPSDISDQKSLQERHAKDENFITGILGFLPQGIVIIDETGNILAVNKAWRQFVNENNYPEPDFTVGSNYLEACDVAYKECVAGEHNIADYIRDVLSGKVKQVKFEYDSHSTSGQRWFLFRINLFLYDSQNHVVISYENITEAKKGHGALLNSEAKFRVIAESTSDLIWEADVNNGTLEWYGEIDEILKYDPGEFPRTISANIENIHLDDRERVRKLIQHSIDTGENFQSDYRMLCKDGSHRYWEDQGSWIDYEQGKAVGGVKDITERKLAEDVLQTSEQRFKRYFELGLVGMAITSLEKNWVEFNDTLCDMLGYSRDEFSSKTWTDLTHPDDLDADLTEFNRVLSGEIDGYTLEKRFIQKNGGIVYAEISAKTVYKSDGSIDYFVALVHDLTAKKEAEKEAAQQRERLAHLVRVQTLGEMSTGIAHEVNQPLAAIQSYTQACQQYVKRGLSNPDKIEDLLEKVRGQAKRAGDVISRLRAMMEHRTVEPISININTLLRQIVDIAEIETKQNDCRLILNLAPVIPNVIGDEIQIQQVVLNLVHNGIDAMVGIENGTDKTIAVETTIIESNNVLVSISDKGKGIEEQDLNSIFEAFYTTKDHGIGMGLAICKNIIDGHGGEIGCSKKSSEGTTMYFSLPIETKND